MTDHWLLTCCCCHVIFTRSLLVVLNTCNSAKVDDSFALVVVHYCLGRTNWSRLWLFFTKVWSWSLKEHLLVSIHLIWPLALTRSLPGIFFQLNWTVRVIHRRELLILLGKDVRWWSCAERLSLNWWLCSFDRLGLFLHNCHLFMNWCLPLVSDLINPVIFHLINFVLLKLLCLNLASHFLKLSLSFFLPYFCLHLLLIESVKLLLKDILLLYHLTFQVFHLSFEVVFQITYHDFLIFKQRCCCRLVTTGRWRFFFYKVLNLRRSSELLSLLDWCS